MTLFLGAVIIVTSVLQYNDTAYDARLEYLAQAFEKALVGLVIAYTLLIAGNTGNDAEMHKYFLVFICLTSWVLFVFQDNLSANWQRVKTNVAEPIVTASLFSLPMVFFAFKS